ncbi:Peroxisomal targeting signal 1 receptor family [Parasponia andersonii]|uniref:Peroxisomal targeting signal 1 receptor family n=1 Tax=Parasponia andersonii TaxID=3476 RepID=A0A2P5BEG3_PARAD|nr:Peroxisomal targeting signal 1 receptor family [Parasponia andersonii]
MAMRELVSGGAACAVPGSSSSSNPLGALASTLLNNSTKIKERIEEIPQSAGSGSASERPFYEQTHEHLPGSEFDRPFLQPGTQGSDFIGAFRSADHTNLADAWDEIQAPHLTPHHRDASEFHHIYNLQPPTTTLDGPPQRVLSNFLHSFLETSRAGGIPFRPAPLPALGLSQGDKQCIRDRSSIMARHIFADKGEEFVNAQVNALLSSLDIDSNGQAKGPLPARLRELEDYWNESQGIIKPGFHATDGWVAEYSQHRAERGDPEAWAHSFEWQHGANGWASEFEQARKYCNIT